MEFCTLFLVSIVMVAAAPSGDQKDKRYVDSNEENIFNESPQEFPDPDKHLTVAVEAHHQNHQNNFYPHYQPSLHPVGLHPHVGFFPQHHISQHVPQHHFPQHVSHVGIPPHHPSHQVSHPYIHRPSILLHSQYPPHHLNPVHDINHF